MQRLARVILEEIERRMTSRSRRVGIVTGTDGTKVVVTVGGATVTIPRLASYTPTNGDVVHIDTAGDSWLVLGKSA